jgi:RNA polymerase sigma-B factor
MPNQPWLREMYVSDFMYFKIHRADSPVQTHPIMLPMAVETRTPKRLAMYTDHPDHEHERERERLVLDFMPLARRVARRYGSPLLLEDLEQVAFLALVKAADRFDPDNGNTFPAYAIPTIIGEIKHFLRDHSWDLHVPRQVQERALQAQRASDELAADLGRAPTIAELARRLSAGTDEVLEALEAAAARDARSLDTPLERDGDGAGTTVVDAVGFEDDGLTRALYRADLERALALLTDEQREIVALRFFCDMTQSEIAGRVGVSQMQVSRMLRRALERMRAIEPDAQRQGQE